MAHDDKIMTNKDKKNSRTAILWAQKTQKNEGNKKTEWQNFLNVHSLL